MNQMLSLRKRIGCFLMAFAFIFATGISFIQAFPVQVSAATKSNPLSEGEIITIDNLSYKVTSTKSRKTVYFVGVKHAASTVSIPATIKVSGATYDVIGIGKNALRQDPELKYLTIGKNVARIKANAFRDCKQLTKIVVNTTKLKSSMFGKNVVKGISKYAKIYVPRSKYSSYKKLFRNNGGSNYTYTYN